MRYQPPPDLPTEFRLALACCRWAYAQDGDNAVARLAAEVDWPRFVGISQRHRVQGLVWRALTGLEIAVPAAARIALEGDARVIAECGLRAAEESRQLSAAFDGAGLPLLLLKGLGLAKLAYGNPFTKMSADVDVLVLPEDLERSAMLLRDLGYRLQIPSSERRLNRWHRLYKESIWEGGDGLVLELHHRVSDQPQLLPTLTASARCQEVEIAPGIRLRSFAEEEMFAYLCVHGASSAWFRLKWITDLAALLNGRGAEEIEFLYSRSQQLGAARAADQALLLAERLYALPLGEALKKRLLASPASRWLARTALTEMLRGEPTQRPFGTRNVHLTQFLVEKGLRYKLAELMRQLRIAARVY